MPPISPTSIPTSFVPKQPVKPGKQFARSGSNTFMMLASLVLGISVLGALLVFGYERYLSSVRDSKAEEVAAAMENINSATVEDFIRTRDRFTSAKGIPDNHLAVSRFFRVLEMLTLQNVRLDSLSFTIDNDRNAEIRADGVARTFNALAAQSSALSQDKDVSRAIFSGISVNDNGTVGFTLDADISNDLIAFAVESVPTPAPEETVPAEAAPSAPATTTPETNASVPATFTPPSEEPAPQLPSL